MNGRVCSPYLVSDSYEAFKSLASHNQIAIGKLSFDLYDIGPQDISCPIICLPPCTCDASIYYKILLLLSNRGYRIISLNYPITYTVNAFCESFIELIDTLRLSAVHLFGSSLGGFIAQKFYDNAAKTNCCVKSLILCNSFTDTSVFDCHASSKFMWMIPLVGLRMMVDYPTVPADADASLKSSLLLAKSQLNEFSQSQLASRLTMNGIPDQISSEYLGSADITIIEVGDLDQTHKDHFDSVNRAYPNAKVAHLDTGGHFPYLSRPDEFAAYMEMHYESYFGTPFSPAIMNEDNV